MRRSLTAVLLVAATLTACGGESDGPAAAPAVTTGSPTGVPARYDDYVAIGDSYTAAPLVPPTDTSTICLRSERNYPALLAEAMPGTELTDVSCSGARTDNTTSPQTGMGGSVPPQFDALDEDTDLVTIGLGGNDDGLFATLLGTCTKLAADDPQGAPCTPVLRDRAESTLSGTRARVADVVEGVHDRAPDARIVVVGYPQIVPASGTCPDLPLAAGDYAFAREVNEGLARAVRLAADDAGAEYVDLWAPSADHDICAAEPWINGRVTSAAVALAYHPMAIEQQQVAELLFDRLS